VARRVDDDVRRSGVTPFHFDRTWAFDLGPEALWELVHRTEDFPRWWSWLREFDAPGLHVGARAECVIQAPLPYALRLQIEVERTEKPSIVETYVRGDLDGPARLEITPLGREGSTARLVWDLVVHDGVLRNVARVARPVMVWAHDHVVRMGVEQFRRRALPDVTPRGGG
jgi:hypothetical protein